MAIQQLISGLSRLERIWQARKRYRAFEREVTTRIGQPSFSLHLTNADPFAAPGGLERYVLESTAFARDELRIGSLIVYPDRSRETHAALLANHQPIESVEYSILHRLLEQLAPRLHSFHLQHSRNWNLGRLHQLLSYAEQHTTKRLAYLHDYHFICRQHNLLWNDQQFCGPPESIETGLCASCVYGPTLRPYRGAWSGQFEALSGFIAPSETSAAIFAKGYPDEKRPRQIIPHLLADEPRDASTSVPADARVAIVFSGATGFNKGIQRYSKLIESHGEKYRWITVGIENYYRDNPRVQHVPYNFHDKQPLTQLLERLKPAVAFLGSVVPETFSYTTHEMLAAGIPILTTAESGNIAATVTSLSAGLVFESAAKMEQGLGDVELVTRLLQSAKRFAVRLNGEGLRKIYNG